MCVCWRFSLTARDLWDKNLTTSHKVYVLSEGIRTRQVSREFQASNWVRCQCKVGGQRWWLLRGRGIHSLYDETLTVSMWCQKMTPNKVKWTTQETLPGTGGGGQSEGCTHHSYSSCTPLLKIIHLSNSISCLGYDSSLLISLIC